MYNRLNLAAPLLGLALLPLMVATPSVAQACGGTFCDNTGGVPMPVDQRGEDILFVQDGAQIEVHVRIQYEGDAESFAWLVPLQALPEISVGSDNLFAQLGAATAANWQSNLEYQCEDEDDDWGTGGGGVFVPDNDLAGASEPDIVLEETVGAFEVVILDGGTAVSVMNWLGENNYEQPPAAGSILQDYLDEGFLLAAVKLTAGAAVDEIHPLAFRMNATEPCVPLRLTRIAAQDDMGVRAYFLGQNRWAPLNYKHVVLNPFAHAWTEATNDSAARGQYTQLLSAAVDVAGGRAFATDYAGASANVSANGIYEPSWDELAFVGVDPFVAIDLIAQQGLNTHPLIQPLLMQFIPPPANVDPTDYWNNLEAFEDQIDLDAWDSQAFATALSERIIEPGLHAADMLDAWPYLTRLVTTISPEEMSEDPIFIETPDLGEVSNVRTAEGLDLCGETGSRYMVPFGDNPVPVCMPEVYQGWPELLQQRPAWLVEQIAPMGPPQVLENYTQNIVDDWTAHQVLQGCADPGGDEGGDEGGDDQGGEGGEGGAEGGTQDGGEDDAGASDGDRAGCACSAGEDEPVGLLGFGLALLGLVSLRRGPRRRGRA